MWHKSSFDLRRMVRQRDRRIRVQNDEFARLAGYLKTYKRMNDAIREALGTDDKGKGTVESIEVLKAENDRSRQDKSRHMIERDKLRSRIWALIHIGRKLREDSYKVPRLEAENERLRKIEYAAKVIDEEWFIDHEECPEEVVALRKALGGEQVTTSVVANDSPE